MLFRTSSSVGLEVGDSTPSRRPAMEIGRARGEASAIFAFLSTRIDMTVDLRGGEGSGV